MGCGCGSRQRPHDYQTSAQLIGPDQQEPDQSSLSAAIANSNAEGDTASDKVYTADVQPSG
jgi:hypothetical protein